MIMVSVRGQAVQKWLNRSCPVWGVEPGDPRSIILDGKWRFDAVFAMLL